MDLELDLDIGEEAEAALEEKMKKKSRLPDKIGKVFDSATFEYNKSKQHGPAKEEYKK